MDTQTYRINAVTADEATAEAVNRAGREGIDIFDVNRVRRSPKATGETAYTADGFVAVPQWIVVIRVSKRWR